MSSNPTSPRKGAPAAGERRAIRNLSAQYHVAALLAFEALESGDLEWVRLVDPDAGRLDDVVIARPGRLDAYQIKWSEYRHEVRFRELVTESTVSGKPYPAPFTLMADGWQRLKTAHPTRRIHAHYLMHDTPSARDNSAAAGEGNPSHLQGFLKKAFAERRRWFERDSEIYATWHAKIDAVTGATKLTGPELQRFLADCELDLAFDLPQAVSPHEARRCRDVEDLAAFFMRQVADSSGPVELRPEDIRRGLGWTGRVELRFKHDFPVDERLYQPIAATISKLDDALASQRRGYLALTGPPGSGKSTTLTHTLRYREGVRLVRYYAFVRDDPRAGRGEAAAFLHDACLSLAATGIAPQLRYTAVPETLHELRDRLGLLLGALGEDAAQNGTRTIILIDGLDHIEREQSPERSLIDELPPPSALPDGVIIILGTQPIALAGPSPALRPIRAQLAEHGRTIEMDPLSRANVRDVVRTALDVTLRTEGDEDTIWGLSGGHPLSLAYLLKRLSAAENAVAAAGLLAQEPQFLGDVEAGYAVYWETLSADAELRDLFALISRIRGGIELSTIKRLAAAPVVERFATSAAYLFRQITNTRWAFFHNSFRQFVLRQTSLDAFGLFDAAVTSRLHQRLAAAALEEDAPTDLAWDALHHLEQSGEPSAVVAHATQERLRAHYLAGRPLADIEDDIHRTLQAAARLRDVVAVVRLLLIHKELLVRNEALGDVPLPALLVDLAEEQDRPATLMSGQDTLVPDAVALRWAGRYAASGNRALAEKLFDAAEPTEILGGIELVSRQGDAELDAWCAVAWRFRPLRQVIAAISQVRAQPLPSSGAEEGDCDDTAHHDVRLGCIVSVGLGIQEALDQEKYAEFLTLLDESAFAKDARLRLDFRLGRSAAAGAPTLSDAAEAMRRVLTVVTPRGLSDRDAAHFADVLVRLAPLAAEADAYLGEIREPILAKRQFRSGGDRPFEQFESLFRQARAAAARRRRINPLAIPAPAKDWDLGRVLFQRLVVVVGTVWGEALAGERLKPAEFVRRLTALLAFRRRSFREAADWHDWTAINAASAELYERALLAAEAHGRPVFDAMLNAFFEEWRRPRGHDHLGWPTGVRRKIVLAALRVDGNRSRTEEAFLQFDSELNSSWELQERLEELHDSSSSWLRLGRRDKAHEALQRLLQQSFGIYHHKDRQIQDWATWAKRLIESCSDDALAEAAVSKLLKLLPLLYETHRGRGTSEATGELLAAFAGRFPFAAAEAGNWLLDQGAAERATVLSALLAAELRSGDPRRAAEALIAAAHLLLPFTGYADLFAEALRQLVASALSADPLVEAGLAAFARVASSEAQSGRHYQRILSGRPEEENDNAEEAKEVGEAEAPPILVRADGEKLGQAGLEALARSPAQLKMGLSGAREVGELDWSPVVATFFAHGHGGHVRAAADELLRRDLAVAELELFADRAAAAGMLDLAETVARRCVEAGRPYGWASFYDGGSRLSAARCLMSADPEGGRGRALDLLVQDYVAHDLSPGDFVTNLDEILPAVADVLPLAEIWSEIDQHLSALVDVHESPFVPPPLQLEGSGSVVTSIELLLRDRDNAASSLAWHARRGLIELLELGDHIGRCRSGLTAALAGSLDEQASALATLHGLAWYRPDLALVYEADVQALAWAPAGVVRFAAQQVLARLGSARPAAPAARALPAIYQLEIPETPQPETSLKGDASPPGEPLPDTDDPYDLTNIYHGPIRTLAERTGYSFDLLVRRMARLMSEAAPLPTWSAAAERGQTKLREDIGLKLTYRRPRALAAQHAFGMLVAELCDGGALEWLPRFCEEYLAVSDPPANLATVEPRPAWLSIPSGRELGAHPIENWLASVSDALPRCDVSPDGRVILAELTLIVSQDHDREEESRLAVIAHRDLPFRLDRPADVHQLLHAGHYAARDYPNLVGFDAKLPIAAAAGGSIFAASKFVALNPSIGEWLGWRLSGEGLFRWVDETGAVMAESLWWAEGNVEAHDVGGPNVAAAEGWLVLAAPAAWVKMRPRLGPFVRHRLAARESGYSRSGKRHLEVAKDTRPLPG